MAEPVPQEVLSPSQTMHDGPLPSGRLSLLRAGGLSGFAAIVVELMIFLAGCFGFVAAFNWFPLAPLALSITGIGLSLIGAVRRVPEDEDTHVLFGFFTNVLGLAGAILEIGVWKGWAFFR